MDRVLLHVFTGTTKTGKERGRGRKGRGMSAITTPVFYSAHQFYPNPVMSSTKISTDQNIQIVKRIGAGMQFDTSVLLMCY